MAYETKTSVHTHQYNNYETPLYSEQRVLKCHNLWLEESLEVGEGGSGGKGEGLLVTHFSFVCKQMRK